MSLLDDEDLPFVESASRSSTGEPFYDRLPESAVSEENLQPLKAKEKKDKRKLEDRRSSAKALPWSKSSAEKTPKKGKHHRTKSGSPPPVSPKGRGQDLKKPGKGTSSQLHPSPNVKSQRKRYVQLGVDAGSSSEGEVDLEGDEGFLLSNKPALSEHCDVMAAVDQPKTSIDTENPKISKEISFFDQETSEAHADAWWPQPVQSKSPRTTYNTDSQLPARDIAEAFLPHSGRSAVQPATNQLLGELGAFTPPQQPGVFSGSSVGAGQPTSSGVISSQAWPTAPTAPDHPREANWSISNDLRQKCITQFNDLKPTEGLLQGDKAREFFVQSKLPNQELSAIWRLSDTDKDNALSEAEFCIAMKLVLMRRKGFEIPPVLPDTLQPTPEQLAVKTADTKSDSSVAAGSTDHRELTSELQLTSDLPTSLTANVQGQSAADQILVDLGNEDSDTGLLVDVNEGPSPPVSPPVSPPPAEPPVAKIISIDTSWDLEEDREDTALVGTSQPKSDDELPSPNRQKPARPAPPKPSIRRAKTVKEKPDLPPRPSDRTASPPASQTSDVQSLIIIDSRQKSKSVRVSGSGRSPVALKKDYNMLGENSTSQENDGGSDEKQVHVRWKSNVKDSEQKDVNGKERDKGHARSTSLDLNKMLLADSNSDVLEDVPSAEPPKPPPKPFSRGPTVADGDKDQVQDEILDLLAPRGRVRALSTGSIDNTAHEDTLTMDMSSDALLFSIPGSKPHLPPKPKRKAPLVPPNKPQRPPPPVKPTGEPLHTKDKAEVQAHIRSLKENNSALTEINGHLEDKLFKLIEERVRLAKQLKELQLLQQQQNHQE